MKQLHDEIERQKNKAKPAEIEQDIEKKTQTELQLSFN